VDKLTPISITKAAAIMKIDRSVLQVAMKKQQIPWKYHGKRQYTTIAWIEEGRRGR
jgi:hypothetical protein